MNSIKGNQTRGGRRVGAGRKKGTLTKRTQEIVAKATAEGVTPLEYLLGVLRNSEKPEKERFAAAIAAAPYVHPRLSNATVTTTVKRSVDELTTAELLALLNETADREGAAQAQEGNGKPH